MTFQEFCNTEAKEKLAKELGIKNPMSLPRIVKIVVNVGAGEAVTNKNVLEKITEQLRLIFLLW